MFSDAEKGRIRHFLGYPSWSALAPSIQLGVPAGSQALYLLEMAFNRLLPEGEETTRRNLCECESIEKQLGEARSRMRAESMGDMKLNRAEVEQLRGELVYWSRRLADDLGVIPNPYSTTAFEGMPGSRNARVVG